MADKMIIIEKWLPKMPSNQNAIFSFSEFSESPHVCLNIHGEKVPKNIIKNLKHSCENPIQPLR